MSHNSRHFYSTPAQQSASGYFQPAPQPARSLQSDVYGTSHMQTSQGYPSQIPTGIPLYNAVPAHTVTTTITETLYSTCTATPESSSTSNRFEDLTIATHALSLLVTCIGTFRFLDSFFHWTPFEKQLDDFGKIISHWRKWIEDARSNPEITARIAASGDPGFLGHLEDVLDR